MSSTGTGGSDAALPLDLLRGTGTFSTSAGAADACLPLDLLRGGRMTSVSTGGGATGGAGGKKGVSSAGISGCPPLISACNCLSLVLLLPLPVGCRTGVSAGLAAARWKPPAGTATG